MGSLYYAAVEGCQIGPCLRILPAFFSCPGSGLALPQGVLFAQGVLFDMPLNHRPLRHAGNKTPNGPVLSSPTHCQAIFTSTQTLRLLLQPPSLQMQQCKQLTVLAAHRDAVAGTLECLHNPQFLERLHNPQSLRKSGARAQGRLSWSTRPGSVCSAPLLEVKVNLWAIEPSHSASNVPWQRPRRM